MGDNARRQASVERRAEWRQLLVWALRAAAADIVAAWVLAATSLAQVARVLVALTPAAFNLTLIVLLVKSIRRLDDFQRRLHFEAVAVAFVTTGLVVLMYGFLQKADIVGPVNVGLVWVPMTVFYCFGYVVAARHYR